MANTEILKKIHHFQGFYQKKLKNKKIKFCVEILMKIIKINKIKIQFKECS